MLILELFGVGGAVPPFKGVLHILWNVRYLKVSHIPKVFKPMAPTKTILYDT